MSVLQVSNVIRQSGTAQLNRQLCPITPHMANLCPITHHADNLSPIMRHGKSFCHARVLLSTAVQLTEKAGKQRSARLARTSFHLFSTLYSLPLSYLEFRNFHFLSSCLSCWQNSGLDTSSPETQRKLCISGNRWHNGRLIHFERGNIVRIVSIHLIGKKWRFWRGISTEFVPLEETNRWRKS